MFHGCFETYVHSHKSQTVINKSYITQNCVDFVARIVFLLLNRSDGTLERNCVFDPEFPKKEYSKPLKHLSIQGFFKIYDVRTCAFPPGANTM